VPERDDPERLGDALRVILRAFLAGSAIIAGLCLLAGWYETSWTALAAVASSAAALLLHRTAHGRTAAAVAFLVIVLALSRSAFHGNGLHDLSLLFVPVTILSASLVLAGAAFVVFSVAAIAAVASVGAARWHLGIPDPLSTQPGVELAILAIALVVSAIGGRLLARNLEHHLARARENERRYRAVFENIQDVYYEMRPDGTILEMSPAGGDFFGAGRDAMIGRSLLPRYDSPEAHEAFVAALREKRRVTNYELRFRDASGRPRHALVSASLHGEPGEPGERLVGSIRDVTERKVLGEKLVEAQRMEALGRLAGGIAHDFNNLLTVIVGHCDLARRRLQRGTDPATEIAAIQTAGERAAELTRQLLAFSRRQACQPTVVDVARLFERFAPMIHALAGRDIRVETRVAPVLPHVLADPGQLEQVLLNLIVNARDAVNEKADPAGKWIAIRLGAAGRDGSQGRATVPGGFLELEVSDGGAGMSPDVRGRIFEPFFTTKQSGSGMGLATVYGIVTQNGGDVEVESAPGQGTSMRVYWPASDGTPAPAAETRDAAGGTELVLLVEDDEAVRAFARAALSSRGYRVLDAPGGREALSILDTHPEPIDAMVTDIVMPGMDGRDLAERVRLRRPGLPVLFTSGHPGGRTSDAAPVPEGTVFLPKPFSETDLARRLRETLRAGRAARGFRRPTTGR
jgi:PAS domain S-box-containing protein